MWSHAENMGIGWSFSAIGCSEANIRSSHNWQEMNLIKMVTSLFSPGFLECGASKMCLALNGTTIDDLTDKCDCLFGYLPTYQEMIRPCHVLSLFDRFNVATSAANPGYGLTNGGGLCKLRNGTPNEFTEYIRRYSDTILLNPTKQRGDWRLFPLESLAVTRKITDTKLTDIKDNNRLGMRSEFFSYIYIYM